MIDRKKKAVDNGIVYEEYFGVGLTSVDERELDEELGSFYFNIACGRPFFVQLVVDFDIKQYCCLFKQRFVVFNCMPDLYNYMIENRIDIDKVCDIFNDEKISK